MGGALDQLPYAISQAMNASLGFAKTYIEEITWPSAVEVRNPRFIKQVWRREFATRHKLRAVLYDRLGRVNLKLLAKGGTKRPRTGGSLAIPEAKVRARRGSKGVPKNLRPGNLGRSFRDGDVIYQEIGRGKKRRLRLMYVIKPTANVRAMVPLEIDFANAFIRSLSVAFPMAVRKAMATRRSR